MSDTQSKTEGAIIVTVEGVRTRVSTNEALLTLAVPLEYAEKLTPFLLKTGQQVAVAFANIKNPEPVQPQANEIARKLHSGGYFKNPALWAAVERHNIYSQAEHKKFIESLPCQFISEGLCSGDVVLHHCRTAGNSGTGIKPPDWFGIPVCHHHHDAIHRSATRDDRAEHVEAAVEYTAGQMKNALKRWLGIQSLRTITKEQKANMDALWK